MNYRIEMSDVYFFPIYLIFLLSNFSNSTKIIQLYTVTLYNSILLKKRKVWEFQKKILTQEIIYKWSISFSILPNIYFNIFLTICQTSCFLIMSRIRSLFNRRSSLVLIIFASRALYRTTSTCNDFVTSNDTDCTVENIAWICKLICRIQIRPAYSADNVYKLF